MTSAEAGSESIARRWLSLGLRLAAPRILGKYVLVGGSLALIEFALFNLLFGIAGVPLVAANLSSIGVVIAIGFVSHRRFTFRSPGRYSHQIRWYAFMLSVSVSMNNLLLWTFVQDYGWPAPVAKVTQIGLCFIWNYSFSRFVVFAQRSPA